jgi:RNA polymerase sigma-70 factor (ECF subfamily)
MSDMNGPSRPDPCVTLLIERARGGDAVAFRGLYERHVGRIHAFALRVMGDRTEAEDMTQDVFVTAWRRLPDFRGEASFGTWLQGIAVLLARHRWRGIARRRLNHERHLREYVASVATAMPTADLDLERALATLPRRMRTALVLHAIEGYTQLETARMMGITEGAVKAHIHRARSLLNERRRSDG